MAVRILTDPVKKYQCMYCSTTMWAFGGIFYADEDINDFLEWLVIDPRAMPDDELENKISQWRATLK